MTVWKSDGGGVGIEVIHVSYTANNLKSEMIFFKVMAKFRPLDYCMLCLGIDICWTHLKNAFKER